MAKYRIELSGVSSGVAKAELEDVLAALLETSPESKRKEYAERLQEEARGQGVDVDALQTSQSKEPQTKVVEIISAGQGTGIVEAFLIGIAVELTIRVGEKTVDYLVLKLRHKFGKESAKRV